MRTIIGFFYLCIPLNGVSVSSTQMLLFGSKAFEIFLLNRLNTSDILKNFGSAFFRSSRVEKLSKVSIERSRLNLSLGIVALAQNK